MDASKSSATGGLRRKELTDRNEERQSSAVGSSPNAVEGMDVGDGRSRAQAFNPYRITAPLYRREHRRSRQRADDTRLLMQPACPATLDSSRPLSQSRIYEYLVEELKQQPVRQRPKALNIQETHEFFSIILTPAEHCELFPDIDGLAIKNEHDQERLVFYKKKVPLTPEQVRLALEGYFADRDGMGADQTWGGLEIMDQGAAGIDAAVNAYTLLASRADRNILHSALSGQFDSFSRKLSASQRFALGLATRVEVKSTAQAGVFLVMLFPGCELKAEASADVKHELLQHSLKALFTFLHRGQVDQASAAFSSLYKMLSIDLFSLKNALADIEATIPDVPTEKS